MRRTPAEYKAALGEKEAADRQYAATQKQVAMDGAQADLKSIQSATAAKIRDYDMDYRAHLISEGQKVAATEAALAQEIAKERDILNQELALDNLRPPERKKVLDELAQLEQNYAQQVRQIQTQAADEAAKSWQGVAKTIEGAVNSQVSSVLHGEESMRTAIVKIAEEIALKFAEIGESKLMENIANQAAGAFGDLGGVLSSLTASALKAVAAGAGETAAGVCGFLAPVLGPAAVPAGLAAGAAISAGARGIGMMDIGAYDIPSTQLAMVHKNELVMPAPQAGAFRRMLTAQAAGGDQASGSRGGDVHHWHIDGSKSPIETAREVSRILERNPSLRGRY
jgi:hypothetical protein